MIKVYEHVSEVRPPWLSRPVGDNKKTCCCVFLQNFLNNTEGEKVIESKVCPLYIKRLTAYDPRSG